MLASPTNWEFLKARDCDAYFDPSTLRSEHRLYPPGGSGDPQTPELTAAMAAFPEPQTELVASLSFSGTAPACSHLQSYKATQPNSSP